MSFQGDDSPWHPSNQHTQTQSIELASPCSLFILEVDIHCDHLVSHVISVFRGAEVQTSVRVLLHRMQIRFCRVVHNELWFSGRTFSQRSLKRPQLSETSACGGRQLSALLVV